MALYPIRTFGDPVLRTPAEPVGVVDAAVRKLAEDMLETMYDAPGVGLAAPQIGVPKRLFVFDIGEGPHVVIDPELVDTDGDWTFHEGCLSVPEHFWDITRPAFARVRGRNLDGAEVDHAGDELLGRVLQHEVDHLAGILLLERLDRRQRRQALKELRDELLELPPRA